MMPLSGNQVDYACLKEIQYTKGPSSALLFVGIGKEKKERI
jgi:hypothetical protein